MNNIEIEKLKTELSEKTDLMLSPDEVIDQIKTFNKGIPPLKLVKPCTVGDGIKRIPEDQHKHYISKFTSALNKGRVIKFVPASGAATRMFKRQMAVLAKYENINLEKTKELVDQGDEDSKATLVFNNNINRFAFYNELENTISSNGKNLKHLINDGNIADIIEFVVDSKGLNYSNLPKGCILFHSYPDGSRTAFEEHLIEAMNYSAGEDRVVKNHFTISPEHENEIKKLFRTIEQKYQAAGWHFETEYSFQSPTTDTVSVTKDNKPFRDETGKIVFRPGGHGALLKNLEELNADIISIKNIDNIVPDHLRDETYKYKKILGGYLIDLQEKTFNLLNLLEKKQSDEKVIDDALIFINHEFETDLSSRLKEKSITEKKKFLFDYLNRPIRICGMVKKEKHPGGGPFWVKNDTGEISKQIVESTQVDNSDENQNKIFNEATHFNPVDLACGVKDFKGKNFELRKFSNPDTGLIVKKSKDGRELKALELPGLWNGGMYYWLTKFVEVPKITFNPVKEVNDLLLPEHQPEK